jgi:23S rRNA G2445 N2-methylase RlmL
MKMLRVWLFTSVVIASVLASNPAPGQEKQPPSPSGQMKSMEKMSMDDMMKDCMKHHQADMKSIDQMSKMMEGAKQSNDPAKMRTAIDQAQKQLAEMKEHMSKCENMMSMMEKTDGMGGMMKGKSK